ncbi:SRPBCC domain-containing protein [Mucilaginibacter sp. AK015]|uniref:SRPBCC family protein n=1 Tax=Mucilaginibacter sp. AK015 TaxID=2723072 RepID=UPI001618BBF9|nr:SRPBCC domain-containing protein [Mucilaginibacter sp. AK015]MBB5396460.1 uncharacterized protein YndB with AHSA1/START domain [Mucilaginibacter sp. AK015]
MERAIVHEFFFAHAPADVWTYLTEPDLLAQWLMPSDFKLEKGHKFRFITKPKIPIGFDGTIYCEVLEIVSNEKLVYSWKGGMSKDKPSLDSVVTWTLTPKDNGTILRLEHSGFRGLKNYLPYLIMNKGWLKIGRRLISRLDTALAAIN